MNWITVLAIVIIVAVGGMFLMDEFKAPIVLAPTNVDPESLGIKPNIKTGQEISAGYAFIGEAKGNWFFEGQFSIVIKGSNGVEIGRGTAIATSEWMTENYVPFEARINFPESSKGPALLIFVKDNPSGLAEYDKSYAVDVILK